ncbi:hypothetical protein GS399_01130 [Pedobacter sp. HMF7647]|uniref:T9SS type A sorting domain-containing protein n=1 Tax=Hufsiella arboris TaxID=2695275 RepID=A0A7K1Y624_9SPHI|nr:hypothetical protein [Hufsiella arboris]MXV49559.1 hypothetical protein [Hufsiella arboris]
MFNHLKPTICCLLIASTLTVKAQNIKETSSVIINNGDTIVNGKNLKDVSAAEHSKLKKEIDKRDAEAGSFARGKRTITKRETITSADGPEIPEDIFDVDGPNVYIGSGRNFRFENLPGDHKAFRLKSDSIFVAMKIDSVLKNMDFKVNLDTNLNTRIITRSGTMNRPMVRMYRNRDINSDMFSSGKNTQNYSFRNTDKDGIITHVNISVSDASKDQWKQITGLSSTETALEIENLNFSPDFSSDKLNISFISTSKGSTTVKVLNSDYKPLFSHTSTFSGNYFKQVALPKNGVYYLAVKQGKDWFVKRFIKD